MELIYLCVGLIGGLMLAVILGRFFWKRPEGISIELHNNLAKAEAVAQQRVSSLEADRLKLNQDLTQSRADSLALSTKIAGLEALRPQIEGTLKSVRADHDQLKDLASNQQATISGLQAKLPQIEENLANARSERDRFQRLSESHQIAVSDLNAKVGGLESEKNILEQQLKAQREFLEEVRKQTKSEFENLANQILKAKAKDLTDQSEKSLEIILKPLQEKLGSFEKKVTDTYTAEAKERFALKSEVERLVGVSDRMTSETKALSDALKGDSKTQGDWGELVLERVLEASGLTEGREYHAQKSHENDDGNRMRPDFRIDLPEGKHIIVDSKVSLTAYELFKRAETDEGRSVALAAHLKSINKHIDDLDGKHYPKLKGVNSPELVFAFIPIEPAYLLAMHADTELSAKAWRKGVAIVTATTLLTSLKTVASIWRLENQNKNALEIAEEAGKLYDKFCGFLDEFQKLGKTIEIGQGQYLSAMDKLKVGRGNVFRKMEVIRALGAAPKNRIKPELVDAADGDEIESIKVIEEQPKIAGE